MKLKSIDNPKLSPLEGMQESAELVAARVLAGRAGAEPDKPSRARDLLLVRGTGPSLRPVRRALIESILGSEDRRQQILETDATPWRMICSLQITSQHGTQYIGTGWFAGPRTVITAGHCVHDEAELGGWARSIEIVPGCNHQDMPFGHTASTRFSSVDRWIDQADPDYDYGVIHLKADADLGSRTGAFAVGFLPDAELREQMVNVSGYPVQPGFGKEQYFHANRINGVTARRLFYDVDTVGGQSGAPVWLYRADSPEKPLVVGIHAYGVGGTPVALGITANSGPRMLPEVVDQIEAWVDNPANG